jgi:uncharacterized membrane protein
MKSVSGRRASLNDIPLGKARIQSLSDAVFALAMALLVLQVRVPDLPADAPQFDLLVRIGHMLPAVLAFLATFLLAGAFWYFQHLTFHFIRHTNRVLVWLNLFFLLFAAALPLCGAMLIRFPTQAVTQFFYFFDLLALGLMLNWHWHYAIRHYMVDPEIDLDVSHRISSQLRILPSASALALALTPIRPDLPVYAFIWVLLMEPFLERWRRPKQLRD